ncbi:MAG TPA: amino acid permease [Acidobacteriota bacterium]|nr:amino acid permease [Acidobacteriota bacterium]HQF86997.1 amino acid permease [Acidobacteriota bacterium]HQG91558.1 amino acid permease [Acidobacteriota bacterium]
MGSLPSENGLRRQLGLFSVTSIVIANMIGAGIFTTSGLLLKDLGDPRLMLILWAVGGAIALCGALCYGALGAAIPRAGGEYVFLSRLFHPVLGFLSGWISFFAGFSAPIAASAIGFTAYLTQAFPNLLHWGLLPAATEVAVLPRLYAIGVILLFTIIHMRGLELGARIQNVLTVLKVLLIMGLVVAGLAVGRGDWAHLGQGALLRSGLGSWMTMGLALMWIGFAYSGWNAAAYIGSEIRDPRRTMPRALVSGTLAVILTYLALNLFYLYALPPGDISGKIAVAGLAAGRLFGADFEAALSVMVAFALFSSLSAYIILGPRVYYAMARDGCFFRFAAAVHPRRGVPDRAILLQGLVAAAMALLGTFDQILTYMGFCLGIFPILAVAGVFKLRRQGVAEARVPGHPVVPAAYILAALATLVLAFGERPLESGIGLLTLAAGVPVYFWFRRRSPDGGTAGTSMGQTSH